MVVSGKRGRMRRAALPPSSIVKAAGIHGIRQGSMPVFGCIGASLAAPQPGYTGGEGSVGAGGKS